MKKPCQIPSQRAVRRLEEMAADGNPAVQMVLPMAEMVGGLHKGVGEPVRQVDQSYRHPPGACIYESNFLIDSLRGKRAWALRQIVETVSYASQHAGH